jgi:hypothetical protein
VCVCACVCVCVLTVVDLAGKACTFFRNMILRVNHLGSHDLPDSFPAYLLVSAHSQGGPLAEVRGVYNLR